MTSINFKTKTGYQKDGIGIDIIPMIGMYMLYAYNANITHQGRPSDERPNYRKVGQFPTRKEAEKAVLRIINEV